MHRCLKIFYIVSVLIFSIAMAGCEKEEDSELHEISLEELDEEGTSGETLETDTIYVHVCGAVENPGVYELAYGSRIYKALEAAGGMTKDAADVSVNQAEILADGQQLYVPSEEELSDRTLETGISVDGKVNINKASKEELMTLSGIGEAKAEAIIRYREEHGTFRTTEEIMEIEGIKEGVFRKIESRITVS